MTSHEHAHPHGYRQYFITWVWLLVMTLTALAIGYFHFLPESIKALCDRRDHSREDLPDRIDLHAPEDGESQPRHADVHAAASVDHLVLLYVW